MREVVPDKRVARKIGVKSDGELDHLLKKVAKEAKEQPLTSPSVAAITSSSAAASTSSKDLFATTPEDITAEKDAEQEAGEKAEEEAAEKRVTTEDDVNWQQADFSFEDAPPPPSKESLTSVLGRKNLTAVAEDSDSEMPDAQPAPHLGSSSKRKGRSTSPRGAKKRALPLKSPRASSAGPKLKAAPVPKSLNKILKDREASPQPKQLVSQQLSRLQKPSPLWERQPQQSLHQQQSPPNHRQQQQVEQSQRQHQRGRRLHQHRRESSRHRIHLSCMHWIGASSPRRKPFWQEPQRCIGLTPVPWKATIAMSAASADWFTSHPQSHSAVMLKNDSRQSHRWNCVHCRSNHPELADHKTAEEGIAHWWKHHSHPACGTWRDKATTELNDTTAEMPSSHRH